MNNTVWKSPNEMFKAAKDIMLEGKEPVTRDEWAMIVNFWAANIAVELAPSAIRLLCKIYNVPLDDEYVNKIVAFQLDKRLSTLR